MKRRTAWVASVVVVALIVAVGAGVVRKRQAAAAVASVPSAPLAVELGPADVFVARVQPLTRTLPISGGLRAVTSAVVKARISSEIKSLVVREGDTVRAGQVIGQLDTTEFDFRLKQAEQTALAARTQLDIAKRALTNNRALVEQGFISPTGLETSVSTEAGAQASYQAAIAAAELARKARTDSILVAPINGIVSQRFVQPGERVGIEAKVVEIVDLSRIELEAPVAPEDVGSVQVGQSVRLGVDGLVEPASAKVARINPSTQAGTRAVMVYMTLQPQPGLRQGLFARGSIELQKVDALVAPVSAVRVDQARPYVLVVQGGKALQRTVELGARGEARIDGRVENAVELVRGIAAGDTLLRSSTGALRDGTAVRLATPAALPASSTLTGSASR